MSSKHRVVVLKIIAGQITVTAAAEEYGISLAGICTSCSPATETAGLDGLDVCSRAPKTSPQATTDRVRDRVLELRHALTAAGTDAGPVTIAWHLEREGLRAPSTSTIRRILHTAGLIVPEPRKRPKSSYIRFEASQPNETWQSDFTHWRLKDGTDVEILNWLDDHSRLLLSCTAHRPVTGRDVVDTFLTTIDAYGPPASTLTDNGRVYTARHGGGRNPVRIRPRRAEHPAEERRPEPPSDPGENREIPPDPETVAHRPSGPDDPGRAANPARPVPGSTTTPPAHTEPAEPPPPSRYTASPKAAPAGTRPDAPHYRVEHDHVGSNGKISFRRAARMHHLGIGATHRGKRCILIADDDTVTVVHLDTGEIIATNDIQPDKTYWRNTMKAPGRWPGLSQRDLCRDSGETYVATHHKRGPEGTPNP